MEHDDEFVKKKIPKSHGAYIKGKIQDQPIIFTVDTGASRTVLSTNFFNKIKSKKPTLTKSSSLSGAGGVPLVELGQAVFSLQLGALKFDKELIIAEIEDECLLGMDILQNDTEGPGDVLLSQGLIILRGVEIPVVQIGIDKNSVRRVVSADHFVIPGYSEAIIDVCIQRTEDDDDSDNTEFIVEPTQNFYDRYPLQMATTLVDIKNKVTTSLRIMNPFPNAVSINQDADIARAEQRLGPIKFLAFEESVEDTTRNSAVRRIQVPNKVKYETTDVQISNNGVNATKSISTEDMPTHLRDLFQKSTENKTLAEKMEIAEILHKYKDSFSKDDNDLGLTDLTEHMIDTADALPIKQPPRRVPLALAAAEKEAIQELEKKGVIRKSVSPWASPIVLVRKKNDKLRPCVDYRKVNAVTRNTPAFPLPRVTDCIDTVTGAKFFSSFDLTSGYLQIPVKPTDIPKTAFCTKYGQYEFTTMPFGLVGSSATFQRTMELILQGLQWTTAIIYIDDIVVFASSFEEHKERVVKVLQRISDANLKLKPDKCELFQESITFLGHTVSKQGVKPCHDNIQKILQWPKPTNVKDVKHILGMGSYYRRFVKGYADIARPLTDLTKKNMKFKWTDSCEAAFQKLKQALVSSDVMGHPNNTDLFVLDVDASGTGIGGVLQQIQNGRERVIAYASRSLNRAEKNYCITQKELLAVRFFVEYFRQYLLGRKFKVRTDHQALVWLFRLKEPRGRIARWIEVLSAYNFTIEYQKGSKMGHADALSRCENPHECDCSNADMAESLKCGPCRKCRRSTEEMMYFPNMKTKTNLEQSSNMKDTEKVMEQQQGEDNCTRSVKTRNQVKQEELSANQKIMSKPEKSDYPQSNQKLAKAQENDSDIKIIYQAVKTGKKPLREEMVTSSPETRHYWIMWNTLFIIDGVLTKKFTKINETGSYNQCIVPKELRKDLIYQVHNTVLSGHLGSKRTKQKLLQKYYWYNMKEDVNNYILGCDICESNKKTQKTPKAPLGSLRTGAPMDCLATDILGPLPKTPRNNRYILVVTDHFSKWVEVLPIQDQTAATCAHVMLNEVISRFGCPLSIHSDQGRNYESNIFKELCQMLEIRKTRTSPKNPKGNAVAERFNKTLVRMIKAYLRGEQENWDLNLGCLASAYRSTVHESTGVTPNLIMLGREVRIPAEIAYGRTTHYDQSQVTSYGEYVEYLKSHMQKAHEVARKHTKASTKRHKEIYDTKISVNKYENGDFIWLLNEDRTKGIAQKLEPTYKGPYIVTKKMSELNFVIQLDNKGNEKLVHHNKLKPYRGDNPPKWLKTARKKLRL